MEQTDPAAVGDMGKTEDTHQHQEQDVQRWRPSFHLGWADPQRLWSELKVKEARHQHSLVMFENHPDLDPQKRAILLSWLSEVCEVFTLRRETYYLSVELVDRFLVRSADIRTMHLQLTGVTALMLAAKVEEIDPPKGREFAYVTDGACNWSDVHAFEPFMSEKLSWMLSPPTLNTWLQLYLQIAASTHSSRDTRTASSDTVPPPCSHRSTDALSDCDMYVLVQHTSTIQLSRVDDAENDACGTPCGKVAPCPRDEIAGGEVCKEMRDDGNREENRRSENKENETRGEKCADSIITIQEETSDKGNRHVCEKEKESKDTCVFCAENSNLVKPCEEKRDGIVCKKLGVCNNKQEEDILENTQTLNIYDCEKETKEPKHEICTLDPVEQEACTTDLEEETGDVVGLEKESEIEDMCFEEDAELEAQGNILEPLYSPQEYVKTSQLMDLVVLDSNSLRFQYSVLAAAALWHCVPCKDIYQLTGLTAKELDPCIDWMRIHKVVLQTSPLRESWGPPLQLDCAESAYVVQNHFELDSLWFDPMHKNKFVNGLTHC
ncbi:hypothetical protein ACOMHN_039795 [Nucella lapillus]